MADRYTLQNCGVTPSGVYNHEIEILDMDVLIACIAVPNLETATWLSEQLNKLARVQDAARNNLRKSSHPGRPRKAVGV